MPAKYGFRPQTSSVPVPVPTSGDVTQAPSSRPRRDAASNSRTRSGGLVQDKDEHFIIDLPRVVQEIWDDQDPRVRRVRIGILRDAAGDYDIWDYGIEIWDQYGKLIFNAFGADPLKVGNLSIKAHDITYLDDPDQPDGNYKRFWVFCETTKTIWSVVIILTYTVTITYPPGGPDPLVTDVELQAIINPLPKGANINEWLIDMDTGLQMIMPQDEIIEGTSLVVTDVHFTIVAYTEEDGEGTAGPTLDQGENPDLTPVSTKSVVTRQRDASTTLEVAGAKTQIDTIYSYKSDTFIYSFYLDVTTAGTVDQSLLIDLDPVLAPTNTLTLVLPTVIGSGMFRLLYTPGGDISIYGIFVDPATNHSYPFYQTFTDAHDVSAAKTIQFTSYSSSGTEAVMEIRHLTELVL